jgi:hypothetical protein
MFEGYSFNKELIVGLIEMRMPQVRVIVDDGLKILITSPKAVAMKGINYQADGYEPQWALPESEFDKKFESVIKNDSV